MKRSCYAKAFDIKERKIFEKRDVFIYAITAIFIFVLFFSFIILPKTNPSNGFRISIDNKNAITYVFSTNKVTVESEFNNNVTVKNQQDSIVLTIVFDNATNVLLINTLDKTIKMIESNCPSHNCVHMQAVKDYGFIYCAPRKIMVTLIKDQSFIPPTTGGAYA